MEKEAGSLSIERVMWNGQKAYKVTTVAGSYFSSATTTVEYYTRTHPIFDVKKETLIS